MTAPRQIVPGRFYAIDRRITQRLFLLRPDEDVKRIFDFCLAEAAMRFQIGLLAWLAMSNHYHSVVYDELGRLPEFLEHFHKMLARALNAHRERRENLWNTDQTSVVHLATPEAVLEKVIYLLSNPLKANLVEKLVDWPGSSSYCHHLHGRQTLAVRPRKFFRVDGASTMPETVLLASIHPYFSKSEESWRAAVIAGVEESERAYKERRTLEGKRVLGRKLVLRTSPFASPTTQAARNKLRPTFATRDPEERERQLEQIRQFCRSYREARLRFADGERDVIFPPGTYLPRVRAGVRCAPYDELAELAA